MMRRIEIAISRTVRGELPRIPFVKMAQLALPSPYSLSLVLCSDALARRIGKKYKTDKKKPASYAPNVLSFPLTRAEGEVFLNVKKARREAKALGIPYAHRIAHLFVHGCLHLRGIRHGRKMDRAEDRMLLRFGYRKQ